MVNAVSMQGLGHCTAEAWFENLTTLREIEGLRARSKEFLIKKYSELCELCATIHDNFRGLRKFSGARTVSCRIDKKIRSHHEAHEGHEERKRGLENRSDFNLIFSSFVNFVTFVVKCLFLFWLRRSRAMISVPLR